MNVPAEFILKSYQMANDLALSGDITFNKARVIEVANDYAESMMAMYDKISEHGRKSGEPNLDATWRELYNRDADGEGFNAMAFREAVSAAFSPGKEGVASDGDFLMTKEGREVLDGLNRAAMKGNLKSETK